MITVSFNYVVGNDIINIVATSDNVKNYEAENLKIRFFDVEGNRIFPEINRDEYDNIFIHSISKLIEKNEYKELEF